MGSQPDFQYSTSFEDEKREVIARILRWGDGNRSQPLDLSGFESYVAIKNSERTYSATNIHFSNAFTAGRSSIGRNTDLTLEPKFKMISQKVDGLILDGVAWIELEHVGVLGDGRACTFLTFKRRLDELHDSSYLILLVSRPMRVLGSSEIEKRRTITDLLSILRGLDEKDQMICRGYSRGDTSKEIAAQIGLTTRSVEIRRQKIMDVFGFNHPIEIVKMLVRLEERGLI